ncbi:hypothetical protein V8C35DRAFT_304476 [Trichoderma chlorosporum]
MAIEFHGPASLLLLPLWSSPKSLAAPPVGGKNWPGTTVTQPDGAQRTMGTDDDFITGPFTENGRGFGAANKPDIYEVQFGARWHTSGSNRDQDR